MGKARDALRCATCGTPAPKWVGRCGACGAWGSIAEVGDGLPVPLVSVDPGAVTARSTGLPELDRVLGGGLAPGSVTLLGGEPGIGKSTLLLQALIAMAAAGSPCLLVCAEESAPQVRARAARLGPLPDGLLVLSETSLPAITRALEVVRPVACVVDSVQTVTDPGVASPAGSVAQVRACAAALARAAKSFGPAIVLVGHVTKEGSLAGPRVLEHVVDTVLSFEGDRHHVLRLLRALKHRFGATGEVGIFEMTDAGMVAVADPSGLFVGAATARPVGPGSAVVATVEGRRPLLVEVQALVGRGGAAPRRAAQGVDGGRVALVLAVLERRAGIAVGGGEVFVSAVGGARLVEPAADLGIALAIVSAATGSPVPAATVAVAEVGLGGELRPVPHLQARVAEAARLGFRRAIVAPGAPVAAGIEIVPAATLRAALAACAPAGAITTVGYSGGRVHLSGGGRAERRHARIAGPDRAGPTAPGRR
ncbi:MAG TPA: DNA repair protein RadA [Acidimicrobiales bacterium]|nr:DNA repair protein RadA [Acidimicrobiales bacterium]